MRKKVLCAVTALFFGLMLFGTVFHQRIDETFREHVAVVTPLPYKEDVELILEIDGEERILITTENFLLIPKTAVQDNLVYVMETVEVPYGSYKVVRQKVLEIAGETEDFVKVKKGLSEQERIVEIFNSNLENEQRVVGE